MKLEYAFFFLFLVLVCVVYSDVFCSYFNSDDFLEVHEGKVHPISKFYSHFTYTRQGLYRPVVMFWYSVAYYVFDFRPLGYHIADLLFYWLVVIAVYYLAFLLIPDRRFAFLAGLLFLFHPIHNEGIGWSNCNCYQISGLFYVLAVIFFIKYMNASSNQGLHYILSLSFFIVALLSLESAITVPVILVVYSLLYRRRDWEKPARIKTVIKFIPYFLLAGIFPVLRAYAIGATYYEYSFNLKAIIQTVACFVLGLFVPSNAMLKYLRAFEPGTIASNAALAQFYSWGALPCALITALVLGLALAHRDFLKEPSYKTFLFFALVWMVITLMPFYLIFYRERFLFLPSIGFSMLLALAVHYLLLKYKPLKPKYNLLCFLILALLINWAMLTRSKVMVWRQAGEIVKGVIGAVQKEYKSFPQGSTLYFIDLPGYIQPLRVPTFNTCIEEAMRLAYEDNTIVAWPITTREQYQDMLDQLRAADPKVTFVFLYKDGRLFDVTNEYCRETPIKDSKDF